MKLESSSAISSELLLALKKFPKKGNAASTPQGLTEVISRTPE